jgi:hypothetical protein
MHAMNDPSALAGMLPFDSIGLYEQPKPRFIFKMPRVVPDQKSKFESDELFRRLSRESEVSHVCCDVSRRHTTSVEEVHEFDWYGDE